MIPLRPGTEQFLFALLIWREARGETATVRAAVGWSVLNRVARPSWWGKTLWSVIRKDWQYSSLTAPGDPQLKTWPVEGDISWQECWQLAGDLIDGTVSCSCPGADSYYDVSIAPPKWTAGARLCGRLGRLVFYDVDHDWQADPGPPQGDATHA